MSEIDTFLMSCRVIGRTVEAAMLEQLAERASKRGLTALRGRYAPTGKNAVAAEVYPALGFSLIEATASGSSWRYDLRAQSPIRNEFVQVSEATTVEQ